MITREEMEIQLADLESFFDDVASLVEDPDLTDSELRGEIRALVFDEDPDE